MGSVLVLGGTSWLGGLIAHDAVGRGHDVTCLARGESGHAPASATFVRADRSVRGAYAEVLDHRWDLVIDLSRQPGQVRSAVDALGGVSAHWTLVSTGSVYANQSAALTESSPVVQADIHDEVGLEHYGEGKVACEKAIATRRHHLIVRAGLIGGPGDRSDRCGYYVSRFALAGSEPVLVPGDAAQPMQVIDARDLATWIVRAAEAGATGVVHGVGEPSTLGELIQVSAHAAGFTGRMVEADPGWLRSHNVEEWAGPRSLPLWLPFSHRGLGMMDDRRALDLGLVRRPLASTLRDTLVEERARGLERERRAGLNRSDELKLIQELVPH